MKKAFLPTCVPYSEKVAQAMTPKNFDAEARSYDLVYTSDKNAHTLLKNGTPMIPMLIPKDLATYAPHLLQLNDYLDYLSTKLNIDVHTYERAAEGDNDVLPEPMIGSEAIELFRADSEMPLNFLNLHCFKANPQPWYFAQESNYQVMKVVTGSQGAGKEVDSEPKDLSSCEGFQICGKKGVFSMPHMDHHGVITVVTCDEGEKLWLTWPHLEDDEIAAWAESEQLCPNWRPMAILLRPGDTLVIPPGRIHAPYSLTDVLMTGTMHWDTRNLVQTMRQSLLELRHPSTTNEDPAKEFVGKASVLATLWQERRRPWDWGSSKDQAKYSRLLEVCFLTRTVGPDH